MSSYEVVARDLKAGVPAEAICGRCPWDRLCVGPPQMDTATVKAKIDKGFQRDEADDPQHQDLPVRGLVATAMYAGRDTLGELCPVFAARLRSDRGQHVASEIRDMMKTWATA